MAVASSFGRSSTIACAPIKLGGREKRSSKTAAGLQSVINLDGVESYGSLGHAAVARKGFAICRDRRRVSVGQLLIACMEWPPWSAGRLWHVPRNRQALIRTRRELYRENGSHPIRDLAGNATRRNRRIPGLA